MKKLRGCFILVAGVFLLSLFVSGATYISQFYPVIVSQKIGYQSVHLINGFSEILFKTYRLFQSNYYQVGNDYSKDGIHITNNNIPKNLKLLVNYHVGRYEGIIQLIDVDSGEIIKEWAPDGELISKRVYESGGEIKEGEELFYNHPIMLPDSSIIANTTTASIFKIDAKSEIVWINTMNAHHSIEMDAEGFIWGCGRKPLERFRNLTFTRDKHIRDDYLFKLDPQDGKILESKSVIDILMENGLDSLLFSNGYLELDALHLNEVEPALTDGTFWQKGDLLLSSKHLSAVFLYRPGTNKVLWFKQGPWRNQHDPDFYETDKIVVFGNQNYRGENAKFINNSEIFNDVFIYDFENDTVITPYNRLLVTEKIKTFTQGRSEILPNGDIFIEETDNGRIIIGDTTTKKLEFVKRVDDKAVRILHWSRVILN